MRSKAALFHVSTMDSDLKVNRINHHISYNIKNLDNIKLIFKVRVLKIHSLDTVLNSWVDGCAIVGQDIRAINVSSELTMNT